ncbi:MAG: hypothetical protein IPK26_21460 [Planctomycetes bacterium]|nr:hypothetical protein [Planctomycetota bacterium]
MMLRPFACTAISAFLTFLPAQDDQRPSKLDAWPKLAAGEAERVVAFVTQLRHEKPEIRAAGRASLIKIGAAAVPMLFQQVLDRADNINAEVLPALDEILKPEHAALMARKCKEPRVELRRYLVLRLCKFGDPEMIPILQGMTKDKDADTAWYAALGLLTLKQTDALPAVVERCKTDWAGVKELVGSVLPAARSDEVGKALFTAIAKAQVGDQMTGLRLARYLATKEQAIIVRGYLSAEAAQVKKEAINAMRALHGMEPIENLSVFQATEMAKEWLAKS